MCRVWALAVLLALMGAAPAVVEAQGWTDIPAISNTLGNTSGRLCVGGGGVDVGCPDSAPALVASGTLFVPYFSGWSAGMAQLNATNVSVSAHVSVTGNLSAAQFVGDGSRLTNLPIPTPDRIVSGTTSAIANATAGTVDVSGIVSATMVKLATNGAACGPGLYGALKVENGKMWLCRP
jgi:hypothetical protein